MGRPRQKYLQTRDQTDSSVSGHEGGGPVRDISGPAQGVFCLGQGNMPANSEGIHHGASSFPHLPDVLVLVVDGHESGRLLWEVI